MSDTFNTVRSEAQIAEQIGINLGKLKTAMGWNQVKMADITGVSEAAMSNYLKGVRVPPMNYLLHLRGLKVIREKGIDLKIDDLLSSTFDPQLAQKKNDTRRAALQDVDAHSDFVGNYLCYYYDQAKPVFNQNPRASRELRVGLMSVYDDVNYVTAETSMKVLAVFFPQSERSRVVTMQQDVKDIFQSDSSVADRNRRLQEYYSKINDEEKVGSYTGDVSFSENHAFVSMSSRFYNDNAMMILHSPSKKTDNDYLGGLGCIASVSRGSMHMPCAQKIIVSRYELGCSYEAIGDYLSMSSAPIVQTEESVAIVQMCRKLYGNRASKGDWDDSGEKTIVDFLDDKDKTAMIENRLTQLVRNYIEKNLCCLGSVSLEEDRKVYTLIKKYAN